MHSASSVSLSTGQETPLMAFNRQHAHELLADIMTVRFPTDTGKMHTEVAHRPPHTTLSPDGCWLLWQRRSGGWRAATLDGAETIDWPPAQDVARGRCNSMPGLWLPDSHRWLESVQSYADRRYTIPTLLLRHRLDPGYRQAITVANFDDGIPVGTTNHPAFLMHHPSALAERMDNGNPQSQPGDEWFSEVDLTGNSATARRFVIALPTEGTASDVHVSPDGTRLVWLIEAPWTAGERTYSIWTSDLEGNDFANIGWADSRTEPRKQKADEKRCYFPRDVQWSPNGQHISFIYGDDLYTVSATTA